MKFTVIQARKSDYPNPIILSKNTKVEIGLRSENTEWDNWIKCKSGNISGWVPIQIILILDKNYGVVLEDYSANELDIEIDNVFISMRELNGWHYGYLENNSNNFGWIPKQNLKINT